ncbi:MAG: HAMP domain-containing protein [Candidatus Omnitrophica bacterium]|nr:HAMP domain-containing protein [Candidatus Omnitrophota bacterium]
MKISAKVLLLAISLLLFLAIVGLVGSRLLQRVGGELKGVVNKDVVLMQTATAVTKSQLQKAVVFERVRRIAEELAYQQTTPARKEHLLFHVNLGKGTFDDLAKAGALNIVDAKVLIDDAIHSAREAKVHDALRGAAATLKEIEKAHIHYDALIGEMFGAIAAGKYELSTDDVDQIHRDERKLSTELENLMNEVEQLTKRSLDRSRQYESTAERALWIILSLSLLAALSLTFWIIRSIDEPLKTLVKAAEDVGAGRLDIHLDGSAKDEVGAVSRAFNKMAFQLDESKKKLEEQREALRHNLEITEQQKKDLERVNRELDRFVQTVSHDIRSPLMGIAWYAEFLRSHYYDNFDVKARECLEGVCRGVDRSNALIKDLLALTRISRVRNPYQYVQIGALLDELAVTLEYKIKEAKVDLKIERDMPTIICDGIKVKEVFQNLLTNAIKFSSGSPDLQPMVKVSYKENVDSHEFIVQDNGIGIESQYHEEIFAIFKRLDTSDKYEGTGAGLSIVKSVIDDHGGKVWVESDLGKGAAFHFTIPKGLEVHDLVVS